jgi:hypothetical protein
LDLIADANVYIVILQGILQLLSKVIPAFIRKTPVKSRSGKFPGCPFLARNTDLAGFVTIPVSFELNGCKGI